MRVTTPAFKDNARGALADANLQESLGKLRTGFQAIRSEAVARLADFEALRDTARDLKDHALANLDEYLIRYEAKVVELGGEVHWARDAAEARDIVLGLCRSVGARTRS